jgi:hypothetical protein
MRMILHRPFLSLGDVKNTGANVVPVMCMNAILHGSLVVHGACSVNGDPHTDRSGWAWKKKWLFIYNPTVAVYNPTDVKALKHQNQVKGFWNLPLEGK